MPFGFGKKSTSNKLSKEELKASLKKKPPPAWNEHEVGVWVELIGLPEHAKIFVDQAVSGSELIELTDSDLDTLGITKFGPRKKLKSNIATIAGHNNPSVQNTSSPVASPQQQQQQSQPNQSYGQHTSNSNSQTNPSLNSASSSDDYSDEIHMKLIFEGEISKVNFPREVTLAEVQKKATEEFEPNLVVKYRDEEDDLVTIRKDSDLSNLISRARKHVKLYLFPAENNTMMNNNNNNPNFNNPNPPNNNYNNNSSSNNYAPRPNTTPAPTPTTTTTTTANRGPPPTNYNNAPNTNNQSYGSSAGNNSSMNNSRNRGW